ncbi:hypothetical protein QW131_06490 [Roseibium salinum]|nr:hypothetical protein [Roseibium salinum]
MKRAGVIPQMRSIAVRIIIRTAAMQRIEASSAPPMFKVGKLAKSACEMVRNRTAGNSTK